jgi:hypothetical protein
MGKLPENIQSMTKIVELERKIKLEEKYVKLSDNLNQATKTN